MTSITSKKDIKRKLEEKILIFININALSERVVYKSSIFSDLKCHVCMNKRPKHIEKAMIWCLVALNSFVLLLYKIKKKIKNFMEHVLNCKMVSFSYGWLIWKVPNDFQIIVIFFFHMSQY